MSQKLSKIGCTNITPLEFYKLSINWMDWPDVHGSFNSLLVRTMKGLTLTWMQNAMSSILLIILHQSRIALEWHSNWWHWWYWSTTMSQVTFFSLSQGFFVFVLYTCNIVVDQCWSPKAMSPSATHQSLNISTYPYKSF